MNRLLEKDLEDFERQFPDAYRFLTGAHLRHERHCLQIRKEAGTINGWGTLRLQDLDALDILLSETGGDGL